MQIGPIKLEAVSRPTTRALSAEAPTEAADRAVAPRFKLPPDDASGRRKWVKETFLAANEELAQGNPDGLKAKKKKMRASVYSFFRGAASLFYLDLAKHSPPAPDEPYVRMAGDVHAENFGTYRSTRNHLVYDLNDFDETADNGPFSWEVMRDATSWILAAREAGHSSAHQEEIARAFVDAFAAQMHEFAAHGGAENFVVDAGNADGPVKTLLDRQAAADESAWVAGITENHRFKASDGIVPRPELEGPLVAASPMLAQAHVEDVAAKGDSGTASLGLPRWYLLEHAAGGDKVVEAKQEIRSALEGVPYVTVQATDNRAAVVADAARTLVPEPYPQIDSFLIAPDSVGAIPPKHGDASFLLRERPALKAAVDQTALKSPEMISVARTQARLLAAEMARQKGAAQAIDEWLHAHHEFSTDTVAKCVGAADRTAADYASFKSMVDAEVD